MNCPICQGLVMGLESSELSISFDFKCTECKTVFTIWRDDEHK